MRVLPGAWRVRPRPFRRPGTHLDHRVDKKHNVKGGEDRGPAEVGRAGNPDRRGIASPSRRATPDRARDEAASPKRVGEEEIDAPAFRTDLGRARRRGAAIPVVMGRGDSSLRPIVRSRGTAFTVTARVREWGWSPPRTRAERAGLSQIFWRPRRKAGGAWPIPDAGHGQPPAETDDPGVEVGLVRKAPERHE